MLSTCGVGLGVAHIFDGSSIPQECWRAALNAALDHGLLGPFNTSIQRVIGIPPQILCASQSAFLAQAGRTLQLTGALVEILASFRSCGIETAVVKGVAIGLLAYTQITKREFTDLDLLIQREDIDQAGIVLSRLGYQQGLHSEKDIHFTRDADDVLVELHWALNYPARRFPIEEQGIWTRLQTLPFGDHGIPTLSLEDTILALCIHGVVHGWTSLKWAYDISLLLKEKADILDWRTLLDRSERAGCRRTLLAGIQMSSILFHVQPPAHVQALISADSSITSVIEEMRTTVVEPRGLNQIDLIFWHVRLHDRMWDRLFVAYKYLPNLHPITASPIRYLIRPIRLLQWYGWKRLCMAIMA
jgi:hypothetical protein